MTVRQCDASSCLGLMVRDKRKYTWHPMMLQAMWMVDRAYGYLKSTFANAALFNTVTKILLAIHTSNQNACATVDVSVSVEDFCGAGLISAGLVLLSISCSESANKGVSLADDDDIIARRTTKSCVSVVVICSYWVE